MRLRSLPAALVVLVAGLPAPCPAADATASATAGLPDGLYAEFATPRGGFVCRLFPDKTPLTVTNFVALAEGTHPTAGGRPYYENLKWYRVVPGFVLQSGNPRAPAEEEGLVTFPDELVPGLRHDAAGVLSMANAGPDTNATQFFVTLADTTRLNYLHSVFGRVVRGLEVLPLVQPGDALRVRILRVGAAAQAFDAGAAAFQARAGAAPRYAGRPEPGPAAHFDDADKVLPVDPPRARNFNFKLANFERATGRKVYARVYATRPAPAGPGAEFSAADHARRLVGELGIARDGVLALYFADKDEWFLWVGDDLLGVFNPGGERLHDRKLALYAAVQAKAAAYTEEARRSRGPDRPLTPADLAKYSIDAMLDALIFAFEPPARP